MSQELKPVYLLAGGRSRSRKSQDAFIEAAFKESGVVSPVVAYTGTANDDSKDFFKMITGTFVEAGASRVDHAIITPARADLKKARSVLEAADIIFVSGGDVERGMEVLEAKKMVEFLTGLYRQGKPFFGLSAGSIMLGKEWVRWRDPDDDSTAELFPCLGFAPVICDTHDEEDGWQELQDAVALSDGNISGYGIASGTAIKVYADGKVEALGGVVCCYIRRSGKAVRQPDIIPAGNALK
jgi:dipeptidase E